MIDEQQKTLALWASNPFFRAALDQTERCWTAQQQLAHIYSEFLGHWFQRRQRAAETALDTTRKILAANGDSGRVPAFCEEWLKGSWQRITEDIREYQGCMGETAKVVKNGFAHAQNNRNTASSKSKS